MDNEFDLDRSMDNHWKIRFHGRNTEHCNRIM